VRRKLSLVVDDEPSVRMFVRAILQREQFDTLEAGSGNSALAIVKSLNGAIDLIVTDVQMPNGDGLTFASEVRRLFPSVPIILISGYHQPDSKFEFVEKPFSWEGLARVVRRVITEKAA
jgi:two-component system, cell cycle sensor histidine kinase and response regulator CckA